MEFVQFHPTGLYPVGLISEVVRGEGAYSTVKVIALWLSARAQPNGVGSS